MCPEYLRELDKQFQQSTDRNNVPKDLSTESSGSLVGNANLISKVYFPRLMASAGPSSARKAGYICPAFCSPAAWWRFFWQPASGISERQKRRLRMLFRGCEK